jgi:RNA polymerase sigma-70 factor (ECF subfamily)
MTAQNLDNRIVSWESHLVKRAISGETVAFELLADMHRSALFAQAMRMLRNGEDANDVVQETLLKAFRAIKDFQPDRPLRPWLCRICSNCCVDSVRNRKRDVSSLDQHEYALKDESQDLEAHAEDSYDSSVVRTAVNKLPMRYRQIIMMRHFKHMDVIEIAEALHKPEGTIKSWLFRARALLKKDLQVALG